MEIPAKSIDRKNKRATEKIDGALRSRTQSTETHNNRLEIIKRQLRRNDELGMRNDELRIDLLSSSFRIPHSEFLPAFCLTFQQRTRNAQVSLPGPLFSRRDANPVCN